MLKDPLVLSLITNIVEEKSNLPIVKCLIDGIQTDEEIAEKTEIKLNIVRKILYRLYDYGLASYKRSKDPKTQWYTYTWAFEEKEIRKYMEESSKSMIRALEEMLKTEESNIYFVCPDRHSRIDFNTASEIEFICPECGEEMEFKDNSEEIKRIKEEINACKQNFQKYSARNSK